MAVSTALSSSLDKAFSPNPFRLSRPSNSRSLFTLSFSSLRNLFTEMSRLGWSVQILSGLRGPPARAACSLCPSAHYATCSLRCPGWAGQSKSFQAFAALQLAQLVHFVLQLTTQLVH